MRKTIALLALLLAAGVIHSTTLVYRWRFQPTQNTCFAYGQHTLVDGTTTNFTEFSPPITIQQGDTVTIALSEYCFCIQNSQGPMTVGYSWEEVENPDGSWSLVSPTFTPLQQYGAYIMLYGTPMNSGSLSPKQAIDNCPGQH